MQSNCICGARSAYATFRSTSLTSTSQLVKQVGSVEDKTFDTQKAFPALFQNLGKLQRPYHIQMKEGAKPFALTALCCVPVPLLPRVKAELERMRQLGVIVPVR